MNDENRNDDSDWLKDAFDRALRGDNGVAPDAARPAANPFGVTPQPTDPREDAGPVGHNELDLDFETESTVPPQAFLPVVDFGDEPADDNEPEPDPFAVFRQPEPADAADSLPTVEFSEVQPEAPTVPLIQPTASAAPQHVEANPTEALDTIDAPTVVAPVSEATPTSSVDGLESLFGESQFSEAQTALIGAPAPQSSFRPAQTAAPVAAPEADSTPSTTRRIGLPKNAVTYGIAGGVILLLGIGGFILGSTLGGGSAAPAPESTEPATATAPREPGTWAWNQLFGGECVDPFPGAWAEEFDVVDCSTPHAAQLVAVGDLGVVTGGIYPGADEVGVVADTQCSAQGVLDLATAGEYPNMQISSAYAPTQEEWDAGNTSFYCFVSLADASPITGSVQGSGVTP